MSGSDARALSRSLLDLCRMRKLTIATAESCTGGLVAGALTDIPGSSDVIDRGFVTYSNDAKRAMLGVKATTLDDASARSARRPRPRWRSARWSAPASISPSPLPASPVRAAPRRASRWASCISRSPPATAAFCIANAASARSAAARCAPRSVVEALRMLMELARGPQAAAKAAPRSRQPVASARGALAAAQRRQAAAAAADVKLDSAPVRDCRPSIDHVRALLERRRKALERGVEHRSHQHRQHPALEFVSEDRSRHRRRCPTSARRSSGSRDC